MLRFVRRDVNPHERSASLALLEQLGQAFGDTLGIEYVRREPGEIIIDFKVLG